METVTEVEVEVTNNAATSETSSIDSKENKESKFSQIRRRITTGNKDGTRRPSGSLTKLDSCMY